MRKVCALIMPVVLGTLLLVACATPTSAVEESAGTRKTATVAEPAVIKETATVAESAVIEETVIAEKPPLKLSRSPTNLGRHVIGFVFLDGFIPLRLAALDSPQEMQDGMFKVGIIEIGEGNAMIPGGGTYLVAIDLLKDAPEVAGALISYPEETIAQELFFTRSLVIKNPAIQDRVIAKQPAIRVGIRADSICFVLSPPDQTGNAQYWQYCAQAGSPASVREGFGPRFENTVGALRETIERLANGGYIREADVLTDMTVSEMEDPLRIQGCSQGNAECEADIVGAPVSTFWDKYDQAKDTSGGKSFAVTAGVLRVLQDIRMDRGEILSPGDYVVQFRFGADEKYLDAMVSGFTKEGDKLVQDQTIPAFPASFVSPEGREEIVSQISALKFVGWCCFWQSTCP